MSPQERLSGGYLLAMPEKKEDRPRPGRSFCVCGPGLQAGQVSAARPHRSIRRRRAAARSVRGHWQYAEG
jgi:hypothetical protein